MRIDLHAHSSVSDGTETPAELVRTMDNVAVLVEDRHPDEPDLLGLYDGIALTERSDMWGGALPDRVVTVTVGPSGAQTVSLPAFTRITGIAETNGASYEAQYAPADADLAAVTFPHTDLAALGRGFGAEALTVRAVEDLAFVADWLERA